MLAGLQRDAVKLEDSLDKAVEWLQVRATPSLHDALLRRQSMPSGQRLTPTKQASPCLRDAAAEAGLRTVCACADLSNSAS